VHEIVAKQAAVWGDRIALVDGCRQLSYGELERRANCVANYLVKRGVKAEARIGLCVNRSLEMVIGMLGILKAGGAYVPLDAGFPPARLRQMIEVSECELILSERAVQRELEWLGEYASVALDAEKEEGQWGGDGSEVPRVQVDAQQLAYVIFTSGSTGVPKAIGVTHRNIVRLIFNRFIPFEELQSYLCAASASFDAFTFELWGALLHAKKAVLFELKRSLLAGLGEVIRHHAVDAAWLTAGLFNQVIVNEPLALGGLKYLLVGGEALSKEHIQRARQVHPQLRLINGYGPTENTTFSCTYEIRQREVAQWVSIPIGKPIDHSTAYILSEQGSLLPTGCVGELYVGGEGVARGYLNRAGLTSQKFVPDPFSESAGARLYRTGDLARWNEAGEIEFIGRADQQVKLRGFRIELGEIESAIAQHPHVRDVVVTVHTARANEGRLVAYVIRDKNQECEETFKEALDNHLRARLPEHCVPSAVVLMDVFPLSSNGKLDRSQLPEPDERAYAHKRYVAPKNPLEKMLVDLWQRNLAVRQVGIDDNYFAVGGDSIRSISLVAQAKTLGIEIQVRDLFTHPTIGALAEAITKGNLHRAQTRVPEAFDLLTAEERDALLERFH
jgi:amino acid adenylation domain-containing protein